MRAQVDFETFGKWQPIYEDHGIYTFPVRDKRPLARSYDKIGSRGSRNLAERNPGADAFGFALGKRSGITVLDVDSPDERLFADALNRHGPTPLIVRSGSGNRQAWYRHNGERRQVRPDRSVPIDILGAGYVVVPPSKGRRGHYEIIEGSLDDVGNLPAMVSPPVAPEAPPAPASDLDLGQRVTKGHRANSLWEHCMRGAKACDDLDSMLDVARTFNDQCCDPPLEDAEVIRQAKRAWELESKGQNRFGRVGAWLPQDVVLAFLGDHDGLVLIAFLKATQLPDSDFMIANGLAEKLGLTRKRLAAARSRLTKRGDIVLVQKPHGGDLTGAGRWQAVPGLYRWPARR
jgi:hypothetical protein